ncbi:MAG: thiamine phosphate synthase [Rhodospirillales bacterium]|nr:thiamine phosphate synthase [Rhodospirillales bacterium]MDH3910337.1 thiamine phosphate synthase [Rhodospirillales bacterium]MDH3967267.1 thiamine phosphate synthase [Rhodospirillales bacterium]
MSAPPGLDLSLYLIAGPQAVGGRDLMAVVAAAVRGGVSLVQLRDKTASDAAMTEQARALKVLLTPLGVPLIVNDRLEVALAAEADGLHLGQEDVAPARARAALGPGRILGVSAGDAEEAKIADPALVDYVGVGPVYPTGSKADAGAAIGLGGLRALRALLAPPMVAIGGIDEANATEVMACGVEGVAVVSAICGAKDPEAAARALRGRIDAA